MDNLCLPLSVATGHNLISFLMVAGLEKWVTVDGRVKFISTGPAGVWGVNTRRYHMGNLASWFLKETEVHPSLLDLIMVHCRSADLPSRRDL